MNRPRLLDLFCKAGGATRGYQLAGFHVTGVDVSPQPRYVGDEFVQADALDVLDGRGPVALGAFDAIHASPPCQAYSALRHVAKRQHPDLVGPVRNALIASGLPAVIEGSTASIRREVMGIDWMNRDELAQAIPPAYTAFIGAQLAQYVSA